MNSAKQLSGRLIGLFPTKVVKEYFSLDPQEVVNNKNSDTIKTFAFNNINNTKQHIYFLQLNKKFNHKSFDPNGFPLEIYKNDIANGLLICFHVVGFKVKILNDAENSVTNEVIKFIQPILVTFQEKTIIVQMTILEKKLEHYVGGSKIIDPIRSISEDEIITQITAFLSGQYEIGICDLNKGIKYLWDKDFIDSKHVKWKKNKSTAIETMDEEYTVKEQYIDLYNEMIKSPLNKTVFKYLKDDSEFVDHFTAEPSYGSISIPIFPKNPNQILNVVNKIISNN